MRSSLSFQVDHDFSDKLCLWLEQKELAMCFRGKGWQIDGSLMAGFGEYESFKETSLDHAKDFFQNSNDLVFCHLNYDVKNQLEQLHSNNEDHLDFPELAFFVPEVIITLKEDEATFSFHEERTGKQYIRQCFDEIIGQQIKAIPGQRISVNQRVKKAEYLNHLATLKTHIQRGNIYQANFCQEFYWEGVSVSSATVFNKGFAAMQNPFSVFYKTGKKAVISFSPERFLKVKDNIITSQPMKGTAPRSNDAIIDAANKEALSTSEKERRENVMIVDLVRNDLSHFATKASVKVPELYRIESYTRVHQMYSTVTAELKPNTPIISALLKAFPMGSMTGAPKVRAMHILEEIEHSKRGIYSGTIGFIQPDGSADFNVVIRSLIYNSENKYLSCHAGGGITDLSDPEAEYEECMVKVTPLLELVQKHFTQSNTTFLPLKDEKTAS